MSNTPIRNLRVSDELWHAAQVRAAKDGRTVTSVVIEALATYAEAEITAATTTTTTEK